MMDLLSPFKKLLQFLRSNRVKFLLIGGYALAAHGNPRYTADIDVFVERSPENARRILATLAQFGFGSLDITEQDLTRPRYIISLGVKPVRIEILTGISGLTCETAWKGRVTANLDGIALDVIGLKEFIRNKKASGRPKDLLDVALLEEVRATQRKKPTPLKKKKKKAAGLAKKRRAR